MKINQFFFSKLESENEFNTANCKNLELKLEFGLI